MGKISALPEDTNPTAADQVVIVDAETGSNKKVRVDNLATVLGGDVNGPDISTDTAVVRYDGTSGKLIQDNDGVVIDDNGTMRIQATTGPGIVVISAGDDELTNSMAMEIRAALDEGGTKIVFWKHPTSSDLTDRIGQITAHGTGAGAGSDEMAFYTTNDTDGTMTNRFKVFANVADQSTPFILTGATGVAKTSAGLIRMGESVLGGGTSKVRFENQVGIMTSSSPSSALEITPTLTNTSSTISTINANASVAPASTSTAEFRAAYLRNTVSGTSDITTVTTNYLENRNNGSGTITNLKGSVISPNVLDGSSSGSRTITSLTGIDLRLYQRTAGSGTVTVTNQAIGLDFSNAVGSAGSTWTAGITYINIINAGAGTIGTQIGIDIGTLTRGTTDIGVRIAKADTYSLQLSDTGGTAAGGITFGTDTTLYRSAADTLKTDDAFIAAGGISSTRITPRTGTTTSSATPTINTDNVEFYSLTAQAVDITSFTSNLSGTPTDGQILRIAITGTATRNITWGASFEASTVALPTATVNTNRLDVQFIWNAVTSKWRCILVA